MKVDEVRTKRSLVEFEVRKRSAEEINGGSRKTSAQIETPDMVTLTFEVGLCKQSIIGHASTSSLKVPRFTYGKGKKNMNQLMYRGKAPDRDEAPIMNRL